MNIGTIIKPNQKGQIVIPKVMRDELHIAEDVPLHIVTRGTFEIAELAGKIARDCESSIEFADAAIAATAIIYGGCLFTLNQKHFNGIPELELMDIA